MKNQTSNKPKTTNQAPVQVDRSAILSNAHQVCGLVDPFCEHAKGAKYPDDSSSRTLPTEIHYTKTLTTDASGSGAFLILPVVKYDSILTCSVTSPDVFQPYDFTATPVPVLTGASKYRVVSAGLRVRSVAPLLTSSGSVYLRSYSAETATSFAAFTGSTYLCSANKDISLNNLKDEAIIIPRSSQMPQTFYSTTAVTYLANDWTSEGLCPVSIAVVGGPASTAVIAVELIFHIEYIFEEGASLALATTPAPRYSGIITSVANTIKSDANLTFTSGLKALSNYVRTNAVSYIEKALGSNPRTRPLGILLNAARSVD